MAIYAQTNTGAKKPYAATEYADTRGVFDYGNLYQFAPYEGGYAFLVVFGVPRMMNIDATTVSKAIGFDDGRKELLTLFVSMLEKEFKSFNGISDLEGNTAEITNNINSMSYINKTSQDTSVRFSVNMTEKDGAPITNFLDMYLRYLNDPKTLARTYGGMAKRQDSQNPKDAGKLEPNRAYEVFTIGVGFTDSSMLNLQKGYIFANCQPLTANWSELNDYNKGDVSNKELNVSFVGYQTDGRIANVILQSYLDAMMNNKPAIESGKINLNSFAYNYQYVDSNGDLKYMSGIQGGVLRGNELVSNMNSLNGGSHSGGSGKYDDNGIFISTPGLDTRYPTT